MEWGAGSCWPGQLSLDCLDSERAPCPCLCGSPFPSLIFPTPSECIPWKPVAMKMAGASLIHLPVEQS